MRVRGHYLYGRVRLLQGLPCRPLGRRFMQFHVPCTAAAHQAAAAERARGREGSPCSSRQREGELPPGACATQALRRRPCPPPPTHTHKHSQRACFAPAGTPPKGTHVSRPAPPARGTHQAGWCCVSGQLNKSLTPHSKAGLGASSALPRTRRPSWPIYMGGQSQSLINLPLKHGRTCGERPFPVARLDRPPAGRSAATHRGAQRRCAAGRWAFPAAATGALGHLGLRRASRRCRRLRAHGGGDMRMQLPTDTM